MTGKAALAGIRVLDLTRLLPGGMATAMLAEFGAEVLKIEQPGTGDYWREETPRAGELGARFSALNRGKHSLALNLKDPRGREILLALCADADVLIEGFRPGVMDRLGLGASALQQANPGLTVVSLSAFGNSGPLRDLASHDINVAGLAGVLDLSGDADSAPAVPGLPFSDIGGALMAVIAVLLALRQKGVQSRGAVAEIAMYDALAYCLSTTIAEARASDQPVTRGVSPVQGGSAWYRSYRTACGGAMVVGAYEAKFWKTFCEIMGCPEFVELQFGDRATQHRMMSHLEALFAERSRAEWERIFEGHDCCVTPSLTVLEAVDSAQMQARGLPQRGEGGVFFVRNPVRFADMDPAASGEVPGLGRDTEKILAGLGYSPAMIEQMRRDGVV